MSLNRDNKQRLVALAARFYPLWVLANTPIPFSMQFFLRKGLRYHTD
jgi:hypothetical protein